VIAMQTTIFGHRERMRDRAEYVGAEEMRPLDLMELLLYYPITRNDTKAIAAQMLEKFGSIEGVLNADEAELRKVNGVGARVAEFFVKLKALMKTYEGTRDFDRPPLGNAGEIKEYLKSLFSGRSDTAFYIVCISADLKLICAGYIADNDSWAEPEYLRRALNIAIESRAQYAVIARCMPEIYPFEEYDIENSRAFAITLSVANVLLFDHIVISKDSVMSMNDMGILDRVKLEIVEQNLYAGAIHEDKITEDEK